MRIVNEYDIEENGKVYHVTEYENGSVIKTYKGEALHPVDETTQRNLEMAMNVEYLVLLAEMNMEV